MLIQNKQIAIIGGGPGGLILARLLQRKGADVKVYERDLNKDARVQGSPLDMHKGSGYAALHEADLLEEFHENVHTGADKKIILNERSEVVFSDHDNLTKEQSPPEIDRGVLRRILLESLQPETMVWDSHFINMDKQDDGWLMHFKNGESAYSDFVVAADGANSKIRPYITDVKALYSGITMVEVNVHNAAKATPHIYKLLNGGKVMAFGYSKCILGGQKGNGDLGFYLSLKVDENWTAINGLDNADRTQLLDWFKTNYAGWNSTWYEVIENATAPLIPRPTYCAPIDQTWESLPNVTMLGDAAHVMPPFAGEGANTAMLDALKLSEYLTAGNYNTLQEAITVYETDMRERASNAAKQSLENGERMHSEGALEKMLAVFAKK